jgi:hypothetical protein
MRQEPTEAMEFPPLPELLHCPFCGCKAVWFKTGRDIGIECEDGFDCPGRAQTNVYAPENRQDVIAEWNRRVDLNGNDIRDLADIESVTPPLRDPRMEPFDRCGPLAGMIAAFEAKFGQSWTDKDWRTETSVWAAAWAAAVDFRAARAQTQGEPAGCHELVRAAAKVLDLLDDPEASTDELLDYLNDDFRDAFKATAPSMQPATPKGAQGSATDGEA